ncbi:MAG: hypothetical protein ABII64_02745 [Elusimicrobiota bacterium]
MNRVLTAIFAAALCLTASFSAAGEWDNPSNWAVTENDGISKMTINSFEGDNGDGLQLDYELVKQDYGYVVMWKEIKGRFDTSFPIVFKIKAEAVSDMEIKFIDSDGSQFFKKIGLKGKYKDWTRLVVYLKDLDYGWGGDGKFGKMKNFCIGFSGSPSGGIIWLDEIGIGKKGMESSFVGGGVILDPNWDKKGYGFEARRDEKLAPENPLVLEWLKAVQDNASKEKWMVPSNDVEDSQVQTFNHSLVAMAFILKGERERAERILDFYANAVKEDNDDPKLQNFFYKGEARGFFQQVLIRDGRIPAYHDDGAADRWMGDMVWLLYAYKYYEEEYKSDRYEKIQGLIMDLLLSWYKPAKDGGYIQHGWRQGDSKLHEDYGHAEGNIDAYAVMKLYGEKQTAKEIKKWLDLQLGENRGMPLDLYTWRVMAFGRGYKKMISFPDTDLRYQKTVDFFGKKVKGVWHSASEEINNIWVDGMGHMACALYEAGEPKRAFFYANQMDNLLIDREINGVETKGIPYALNLQGGFEWLKFDRGFASCAAWYIFAKNQFNPMNLKKYNYK